MKKTSPAQDFSSFPASKPSEQDVLAGLKQREDWAYRALIEQWSQKLYRVAFCFLKKQEDAEEIVQEALQKVVEKIATFQQSSSLYTWLYRITVNESLMRIRSQQGKQSLSWEELAPKFEHGMRVHATEDWSTLPDQLFAQKEVQEFVSECVSQLPEELRNAYVLKDMEELSEDEVCAILQLTKPAMKNRVHRARLTLREQLERKYVR